MANPLLGSARVFESALDHEYTIGDLAREFGVTLRTLRFYEDKGLLTPRREGHARIYDRRSRARLAIILKAKQLGFTLSEIKEMVANEMRHEEVSEIQLSSAALEEQIAHLERQQLEIQAALAELKSMRAQMLQAA